MAEQDRYIPGVPCWVDTSQPDPEAAVEFYGGLFGWQFENVMPAPAPGKYFIARLDGGDVAAISSQPEGGPPAAVWSTYVWVESADETAARVRDAGGSVLTDPFDVMDAGRMAVLSDAEGAVFCAWQPKRHRGAQVVNLPGSLNFNGLATRDAQGAKSFYRAVFGWETLTLPGGVEMWRLPGYGDFLERSNGKLREQMAEAGAPAGFEDVVASLNPIAAGEQGVPPHWRVTFAVDDADAVAAKAAELGGSVLVAPFDAPWVRMAVISDPQGASFIASRYTPENRDLAAAGAAAAAA